MDKIKTSKFPYFFLIPSIFIMCLIVYYPLIKLFWFSFTDIDRAGLVSGNYNYIGLANFRDILLGKDTVFYTVLFQTIIWTISNVFFHFVIGLFLAVQLNKKIKFTGLYRTLLMIPWAVPTFISAFGWKFLFNGQYGFFNIALKSIGFSEVPWLSDPFWVMVSVIIVNIWVGVPFMTVTLLGGLQNIPRELYEAADVDGASNFNKFKNITLPLLWPVASVAVVLGIIWTFNMFNIIYLVADSYQSISKEILVTYAYKEAFDNWALGKASSYGILILMFLFIFSSFYFRILKKRGEM